MAKEQNKTTEEFQVSGAQVVEKVKELIRAGNVRRIIVKNEQGDTLVEIPVTLALVGTVLAPVLAALGALAALLSRCTLVVEKRD